MLRLLPTYLACLLVSATLGEPSIQFKRVNDYEWVYNDGGTGADRDVSVWRPLDRQAGFCALGDVAVASHGRPPTSTVTVNGLKSGAVVNPTSFTEIWADHDSGGRHDVRIMRMNAPAGYRCLGYVAVLGYKSQPPRNRYCCVRSQFVSQAQMEQVWNDKGSGAHRDVSFWQVLKAGSLHGIEAANFLAVASHGRPRETPYLLKESDQVVNAMSRISGHSKPIHLYENRGLTRIWKDSGSGANRDVAFWRVNAPRGFYSLGDTAQANHNKPTLGYMAKPIKSDSLRPPVDYRERWNDGGSGANRDVKIWEPVCPSGYRALGYVTRASYHGKPSRDDVRCVKGAYTTRGKWNYVWNDAGSGARQDCTVWMAAANNHAGQGVAAISAVNRHSSMGRTAYVLSSSSVNYYSDKPAKSYELKDVTYDLNRRHVLDVQPDSMGVTVVKNSGTLPQTATRTISYSYTQSYSWSNSLGVEIGISTTVEAGIPLVGKASTTVSVTTSYSYTWGGQKDETKSDDIAVSVQVPARSQITATVTGRRYKANVPYRATLVKHYYDGTTGVSGISGVYQGVNINEVEVIYGAAVPL